MNRIKHNDTVKVLSGKDAGKEGRVVRVYPRRNKVMVEGINVATRHSRLQMSRRGAQEGGIEHIEVPLDMSNVMPVCPECNEPTRVGTTLIDGQRMRMCRRCKSEF